MQRPPNAEAGGSPSRAQTHARAGLSLLLAPAKAAQGDDAALRPLAKAFAGKLAETLAARYGLRAGFAPDAGPEDAEPGPGLVVTMQGEDGAAAVEIGQSALYDLIDALFGGDGSAQPYRDARKPSELERAIVEGLAPAFAYALGEALGRADIAQARVVAAQERPPGHIAAGLKMRLIGRDSRLTLIAPRAWLGLSGEARAQEGGAPALDALALDLAVSMQAGQKPLSDMIGMKVGDVLRLGLTAASLARVEAEGVALFDAELGQSGGRYTIRLARRLDGAVRFFEESSR